MMDIYELMDKELDRLHVLLLKYRISEVNNYEIEKVQYKIGVFHNRILFTLLEGMDEKDVDFILNRGFILSKDRGGGMMLETEKDYVRWLYKEYEILLKQIDKNVERVERDFQQETTARANMLRTRLEVLKCLQGLILGYESYLIDGK